MDKYQSGYDHGTCMLCHGCACCAEKERVISRYEEALGFYATGEAFRSRWHEDFSQMDADGTPNGKEAATKPTIGGQVARNVLEGRIPFFRSGTPLWPTRVTRKEFTK